MSFKFLANSSKEFAENVLDKVGLVKHGSCTSTVRLDGKTAIITGSNRGIGKETARDLAKRGAKIIMACRDTAKGREAADEILAETSGGATIIVHKLDLASIESINYFARTVLDTEKGIDILVNNAGVWSMSKESTKDGFERNLGTNFLGPFLLTLSLLERIRMSPIAKIINLASSGHYLSSTIKFEDINYYQKYNALQAYGQSKLAMILFTLELARRASPNVHIYSVHPGPVKTDLFRENPAMFRLPLLSSVYKFSSSAFQSLFFKSVQQGAQTVIYCAVDEKAATETGLYYSDCKITKPGGHAVDGLVAKRLWEMSCDMLGLPAFKFAEHL